MGHARLAAIASCAGDRADILRTQSSNESTTTKCPIWTLSMLAALAPRREDVSRNLSPFHRDDEAFAQFAAAQHRDARLMADALVIEQPQKIVNARHGMTIDGDDEIARLDAALICGTLVDHLHHTHAHVLDDAGVARDVPRHHALLAFDADRGTAHPSMLKNLAQHIERGVAGDREADALG